MTDNVPRKGVLVVRREREFVNMIQVRWRLYRFNDPVFTGEVKGTSKKVSE